MKCKVCYKSFIPYNKDKLCSVKCAKKYFKAEIDKIVSIVSFKEWQEFDFHCDDCRYKFNKKLKEMFK